MNQIAVIDYGMGNLHSMAKALERVAPKSRIRITDDADTLRRADRIVFPGVGAIGACMRELANHDLIPVLQELADHKPMLGVCLGMQALFEESEEGGGQSALGIIPGRVRRFTTDDPRLKVPHMGWNRVDTNGHTLWNGIDSPWFYFVHSYYCEPTDPARSAGECHYGKTFCAAVAQDNLFAVQFHPEKSQADGLRLLANFADWRP
jgi:glutamine amidotransferase